MKWQITGSPHAPPAGMLERMITQTPPPLPASAPMGLWAAPMSVFAAGGSVGFFLAPVLATPALVAWGVGATALFIPPAVLIAYVLLRHQGRAAVARSAVREGTDRWRPFLTLTGIEVVRS